jgi:hypothetical protein
VFDEDDDGQKLHHDVQLLNKLKSDMGKMDDLMGA